MAGEDTDADEPDVADDEPEDGSSEAEPASEEAAAADPDPERTTESDDDGDAEGDAGHGDEALNPTETATGTDPDAEPVDAAREAGSSAESTTETGAGSDQIGGDDEAAGGDPEAAVEGTDDAAGTEDADTAADSWEPVGGPDAVEAEGIAGAASDTTDDEAAGAEADAGGTDAAESATETAAEDDEAADEPSWETWFHGEEEAATPETSTTDEETDLEASIAADDADRFDGAGGGLADAAAGGVFGARQAPDEDQEMPLTAHVEEMLKRLAVVVAVAGVVSLLTFPFADRLINVIWYGILPGTDVARPRVYGILSLLFTRIKVASLAGIIAALPVLVYQTYQFMRPGLYPHERRYYLAAIPTSLVLAIVGVSFAYFIVLPAIFTYFLYYSESVATIGFALMKTFDLILLLMGYLAVVFQIPLFIMLAMMMGLVTRRWLADRRLIFWGAFLGISFLFSPDPTGMAPVIVALTMVGLFEGTLLVARWAGR